MLLLMFSFLKMIRVYLLYTPVFSSVITDFHTALNCVRPNRLYCALLCFGDRSLCALVFWWLLIVRPCVSTATGARAAADPGLEPGRYADQH